MTSKLAVVPAIVRYQGVELQSGRMLAVEMEQPADGFAVVHQDGDDLEIWSCLGFVPVFLRALFVIKETIYVIKA